MTIPSASGLIHCLTLHNLCLFCHAELSGSGHISLLQSQTALSPMRGRSTGLPRKQRREEGKEGAEEVTEDGAAAAAAAGLGGRSVLRRSQGGASPLASLPLSETDGRTAAISSQVARPRGAALARRRSRWRRRL